MPNCRRRSIHLDSADAASACAVLGRVSTDTRPAVLRASLPEPAHAGYIGSGMLSAAVVGEIFTSPSVDSVIAAIRAVAGRPGVLLIVKNYTGDRINFGLAAEIARSEGILVETVVVADDVALANTQNNAGRRGIAGTVLVHKIAGAAAAEGKDLPQVAALAQAAAESVGTMGVSLSAGVSPATGQASFTLGDEVELGLGRHPDNVTFAVRDTGIGISAADFPHIFERFWRADRVRSRMSERGGFGLGLAISQWIAQAHGGTLTASSRLGRGSLFTVTLPLGGDGQRS